MLQKTKTLINNFLKLNGYVIKKLNNEKQNIVYFDKQINSLKILKKLLLYRDQKLVFRIPIKYCIMGLGFNCSVDANPYSYYLKMKNKNIINNFYNRFKPNNIFDALNLNKLNRSKPSKLISNPILKFYNNNTFKGLNTLGFKKEDGHILNGPISSRLEKFEIERLNRLYFSIKSKGWKPLEFKTGFIRGIFLIYKNKFLFNIIGGNHRAACLAALKKKYFECWFQPYEPRFVTSEFFNKNSSEHKVFKLYFSKILIKKRNKFISNLNTKN